MQKNIDFLKIKIGKYNVPKEFYATVQYGNELKTMCSILNAEGIVALDRLSDFVKYITHDKLSISKGSIFNFLNKLNEKADYLIDDIKNKILNLNLIYTDGTTARCNNRNICVRNYSNENYTYLVPTYGKGKKYIEETNVLNKFTGTVVHDHETVIYNYGTKHVECNVHITRYLKGCYENTKNKWALKMRSFLCSLNEYRKRLKQQEIEKMNINQLNKYSKRYDEIILEGYEQNKKIKSKYIRQEEQKLINRLKKYKENHLMFLYDFTVPFDNNLSERDLRHVKIKQKISGKFNNLNGIKIYLNIKSIIITLKKQEKNIYKEIFNLYKNIPVEI